MPIQDEWGPLIPPQGAQSASVSEDEWGPLVPPPSGPKSKLEQAKELLAGMEAAGTLPRVGMWGSSGAKPITETVSEAGGPADYWKQLISQEGLAKTGRSAVEGIKGLAQMPVQLGTLAGRAMSTLAGKQLPPQMGEQVEAGASPIEPIKQVADMATYPIKILKAFAANPVQAIQEHPVDLVLMTIAPALGKRIGKLKAELKSGILTNADLSAALRETAAELNKAGADFNATTAMVHQASVLERNPSFMVNAKGGAKPTGHASRSLIQEGLDIQAAPLAKTMEQGPKTMPHGLPTTVMDAEIIGAPSSAVEAALRAYAKAKPDAYNTALRVGGEIQIAGRRMKWDTAKNQWIDVTPTKELHAGAKPGDDRLRMMIEGLIDDGDVVPPEVLAQYPDLAAKARAMAGAGGETPKVGLGLQNMTPESMAPAQRAAYDKMMTRRGGSQPATPSELPATTLTAPAMPEHAQVIMAAIKEAKPLRRQQEAIYRAERSKRLGAAMRVGEQVPGEAGFHAQLKELKGPMDKVEFESIRNRVSQENIDSAFRQIEHSPAVSGYEKIRAKEGLAKMLGERGGGVPQPGELELLKNVFGKEFVDTVAAKAPLFQKMKALGLEIANVPRSIMASMDLSFGLRQGVMLAARHPQLFAKSFIHQFKLFTSEKSFKGLVDEIKSRPNYPLMEESGLALTNLGKELRLREEPFQAPIAEKIPLMGAVVRGSNRAYAGFANKLRADVFDYLIKQAEKMGENPHENIKLAKDIATVVNTASGRGKLGATLERAAPALNATFFSPRLMASRLQTLNPSYYIKLSPFARKEALKTLLSFVGAGTTVVGLAKLAGAKVGTDWRSADFGKIRIGNTRIDVWGGFSQYARFAGQLLTGEVVSSTSGRKIKLGEGYKPLTRLDIAQRFMEYKTAPVVSFAIGLLRGKGFQGEKYNLPSEFAKRFIPMVISDMVDLYKDDPESMPLAALGAFGVGIQTYSRKPTTTTSTRGW